MSRCSEHGATWSVEDCAACRHGSEFEGLRKQLAEVTKECDESWAAHREEMRLNGKLVAERDQALSGNKKLREALSSAQEAYCYKYCGFGLDNEPDPQVTDEKFHTDRCRGMRKALEGSE